MSNGDAATRLTGELTDAPRGSVATALFALTGVALVRAVLRIAGRVAFAYYAPQRCG